MARDVLSTPALALELENPPLSPHLQAQLDIINRRVRGILLRLNDEQMNTLHQHVKPFWKELREGQIHYFLDEIPQQVTQIFSIKKSDSADLFQEMVRYFAANPDHDIILTSLEHIKVFS